MKLIVETAVIAALVLVAAYLVGAFTCANFNIAEWAGGRRDMFAFLGVVLASALSVLYVSAERS